MSFFSDSLSFAETLFDIFGSFIIFIGSCINFLCSSVVSLIGFIKSFLFELPVYIFSIFGGLPDFVFTGFSIVLSLLVFALILKLISLIIPFI